MTSLRWVLVLILVSAFAFSSQPVYAANLKACDILLGIDFDSGKRAATYTITVNARMRPEATHFIVEVNGDFKRASFEEVSKEDQLYKATIEGETLSPIDLTGPEQFPFDQYEIDIVIHLPFPPDTYSQLNPPVFRGSLLQAKLEVVSNTRTTEGRVLIDRPLTWQVTFLGFACIPIVVIFAETTPKTLRSRKKAFGSLLAVPIVSGVALDALLTSFQYIPSRNALSYYEWGLVLSVVLAIVYAFLRLRR